MFFEADSRFPSAIWSLDPTQPQPSQTPELGLMLTGSFQVCIKVITFQSIMLFKGLRILPLALPAPVRTKRRGKGGSIKCDYKAQAWPWSPQSSFLCPYTWVSAEMTTWTAACGSTMRHVLDSGKAGSGTKGLHHIYANSTANKNMGNWVTDPNPEWHPFPLFKTLFK